VPGCAEETAYYLNGKLPRLALISKGVRFPAGTWIRLADGMLAPWDAENLARDLFPALQKGPIPFIALLCELDVVQFEQDLRDDDKGMVA